MGDSWQHFHSRFMDLAREEQGRTDIITKGETLQRMNKVLRASCNYKEHPEGWERGKPEQGLICLLKAPPHGVWNYDSNGISENFFERLRLCVAEAGRALPDYPKGADSEDFWLHRLYFDLLKNKSDLLFCGSNQGGMVLSVCVASATFCARLERQAIQHTEPASTTGGDRLITAGNHTEPSPAENSGKTTARTRVPANDEREIPKCGRRRRKKQLTKREKDIVEVLKDALKKGQNGIVYCHALELKRIPVRQEWIEQGCPATYPEAYKISKWKKRIQDEKYRLSQLLPKKRARHSSRTSKTRRKRANL